MAENPGNIPVSSQEETTLLLTCEKNLVGGGESTGAHDTEEEGLRIGHTSAEAANKTGLNHCKMDIMKTATDTNPGDSPELISRQNTMTSDCSNDYLVIDEILDSQENYDEESVTETFYTDRSKITIRSEEPGLSSGERGTLSSAIKSGTHHLDQSSLHDHIYSKQNSQQPHVENLGENEETDLNNSKNTRNESSHKTNTGEKRITFSIDTLNPDNDTSESKSTVLNTFNSSKITTVEPRDLRKSKPAQVTTQDFDKSKPTSIITQDSSKSKPSKVETQNSNKPESTTIETPNTDKTNPTSVVIDDSIKSKLTTVEPRDSNKHQHTTVKTQDSSKFEPTQESDEFKSGTVVTQDSSKSNTVTVVTQDSDKSKPTTVKTQDSSKSKPTTVETQDSSKFEPTLVKTQESDKSKPGTFVTHDSSKSKPVTVVTQDSEESKPTTVKTQGSSKSEPGTLGSQDSNKFTVEPENSSKSKAVTIVTQACSNSKQLVTADSQDEICYKGKSNVVDTKEMNNPKERKSVEKEQHHHHAEEQENQLSKAFSFEKAVEKDNLNEMVKRDDETKVMEKKMSVETESRFSPGLGRYKELQKSIDGFCSLEAKQTCAGQQTLNGAKKTKGICELNEENPSVGSDTKNLEQTSEINHKTSLCTNGAAANIQHAFESDTETLTNTKDGEDIEPCTQTFYTEGMQVTMNLKELETSQNESTGEMKKLLPNSSAVSGKILLETGIEDVSNKNNSSNINESDEVEPCSQTFYTEGMAVTIHSREFENLVINSPQNERHSPINAPKPVTMNKNTDEVVERIDQFLNDTAFNKTASNTENTNVASIESKNETSDIDEDCDQIENEEPELVIDLGDEIVEDNSECAPKNLELAHGVSSAHIDKSVARSSYNAVENNTSSAEKKTDTGPAPKSMELDYEVSSADSVRKNLAPSIVLSTDGALTANKSLKTNKMKPVHPQNISADEPKTPTQSVKPVISDLDVMKQNYANPQSDKLDKSLIKRHGPTRQISSDSDDILSDKNVMQQIYTNPIAPAKSHSSSFTKLNSHKDELMKTAKLNAPVLEQNNMTSCSPDQEDNPKRLEEKCRDSPNSDKTSVMSEKTDNSGHCSKKSKTTLEKQLSKSYDRETVLGDVGDSWEKMGMFRCKKCSFTTEDESLSQSHVALCSNKKSSGTINIEKVGDVFHCMLCLYNTNVQTKFEEHLAFHIIAEPYICLACRKTFVGRKQVDLHIAFAHKTETVQCGLRASSKIKEILSELEKKKKHDFVGRRHLIVDRGDSAHPLTSSPKNDTNNSTDVQRNGIIHPGIHPHGFQSPVTNTHSSGPLKESPRIPPQLVNIPTSQPADPPPYKPETSLPADPPPYKPKNTQIVKPMSNNSGKATQLVRPVTHLPTTIVTVANAQPPQQVTAPQIVPLSVHQNTFGQPLMFVGLPTRPQQIHTQTLAYPGSPVLVQQPQILVQDTAGPAALLTTPAVQQAAVLRMPLSLVSVQMTQSNPIDAASSNPIYTSVPQLAGQIQQPPAVLPSIQQSSGISNYAPPITSSLLVPATGHNKNSVLAPRSLQTVPASEKTTTVTHSERTTSDNSHCQVEVLTPSSITGTIVPPDPNFADLRQRFGFRYRVNDCAYICYTCKKLTQQEITFKKHVHHHLHQANRPYCYCGRKNFDEKDQCKLVRDAVNRMYGQLDGRSQQPVGTTAKITVQKVKKFPEELIVISDDEENTNNNFTENTKIQDDGETKTHANSQDSNAEDEPTIKILSTFSLSHCHNNSNDKIPNTAPASQTEPANETLQEANKKPRSDDSSTSNVNGEEASSKPGSHVVHKMNRTIEEAIKKPGSDVSIKTEKDDDGQTIIHLTDTPVGEKNSPVNMLDDDDDDDDIVVDVILEDFSEGQISDNLVKSECQKSKKNESGSKANKDSDQIAIESAKPLELKESEDHSNNLRRLSTDSSNNLRKLSTDSSNNLRRLSTDSSNNLRRLSTDSQKSNDECRGKTSKGDSSIKNASDYKACKLTDQQFPSDDQMEVAALSPSSIASLTEAVQGSQVNTQGSFYVCGFSDCVFTCLTSNDFRTHLQTIHKNASEYICAHCNHQSFTEDCYVRHLFNHSTNKHFVLFACGFKLCKFGTNLIGLFRDHMVKFHPSEKKFKCASCKEQCGSLEGLVSHLQSNLLKFVQCPYCSVKDGIKKNVLKHISQTHPGRAKQITVTSQLICQDKKMNLQNRKAPTPTPRVPTPPPSTPLPPPSQPVEKHPPESPGENTVQSVDQTITKENTGKKTGKETDKNLTPINREPGSKKLSGRLGPKSKPNIVPKPSGKLSAVIKLAKPGSPKKSLVEHHPDSLQCDQCSYVAWNTIKLAEHVSLHDQYPIPSAPFRCNYCPMAIERLCKYKQHLSCHAGNHKVTIYSCRHCAFKCNQSPKAEAHVQIYHENIKQFQNMKIEKLEVKSTVIKCGYCNFLTRQEKILRQHEAEFHTVLMTNEKCDGPVDSTQPSLSESGSKSPTSGSKSPTSGSKSPTSSSRSKQGNIISIKLPSPTLSENRNVFKHGPGNKEERKLVPDKRQNQNSRRFHCIHCMEQFFVLVGLKNHICTHHKAKSLHIGLSIFFCKLCDNFCSTRYSIIEDHYQKVHPDQKKDIGTRNEQIWSDSEEIQYPDSPCDTFHCELCSSAFQSTLKLKEHKQKYHKKAATAQPPSIAPNIQLFQSTIKLEDQNKNLSDQALTESPKPESAAKLKFNMGGEELHRKLEPCFQSTPKGFTCLACLVTIVKKEILHRHLLQHLDIFFHKCLWCDFQCLDFSTMVPHISHEHKKPIKCHQLKYDDNEFDERVRKGMAKLGLVVTPKSTLVSTTSPLLGESPSEQAKNKIIEPKHSVKKQVQDHKTTSVLPQVFMCPYCREKITSKPAMKRHFRLRHKGKTMTFTTIGNSPGNGQTSPNSLSKRPQKSDSQDKRQKSPETPQECVEEQKCKSKGDSLNKLERNSIKSQNNREPTEKKNDATKLNLQLLTKYRCRDCGVTANSISSMYTHFSRDKCNKLWYQCRYCSKFKSRQKKIVAKHITIRHKGKPMKIGLLPLRAKITKHVIPVRSGTDTPKAKGTKQPTLGDTGKPKSATKQPLSKTDKQKRTKIQSRPKPRTGELYPIRCPMCKYVNSSLASIEKHIDARHPNTDIKCKFCNFEERNLRLLEKHCKRNHKKKLSFLLTQDGAASTDVDFELNSESEGESTGSTSESGDEESDDESSEEENSEETNEESGENSEDSDPEDSDSEDSEDAKVKSSLSYSCRFCRAMYQNRSKYWNHIRTHFGYKPYMCSYCKLRLSSLAVLKTHISIMHSDHQFQLKYMKEVALEKKINAIMQYSCSKDEKYKENMPSDLMYFYRSKSEDYECLKCKMVSANLNKMESHVVDKHRAEKSTKQSKKPERKIKATRMAKDKTEADYKLVKRNGIEVYVCLHCDLEKSSIFAMKYHQYSHSTIQYKCGYCGYISCPRSIVKKHIIATHRNRSPKIIEVNISEAAAKPIPKSCINDEKDDDVSSLFTSERSSDESEEGDNISASGSTASRGSSFSGKNIYCCSECRYKVSNLFHFRQHLVKHQCFTRLTFGISNDSPLRCGYCSYIAIDEVEFSQHMAVHLDQRQFKCGYCDYNEFRRPSIRKHIISAHPGMSENNIIDLKNTQKSKRDFKLVDLDPHVCCIDVLGMSSELFEDTLIDADVSVVDLHCVPNEKFAAISHSFGLDAANENSIDSESVGETSDSQDGDLPMLNSEHNASNYDDSTECDEIRTAPVEQLDKSCRQEIVEKPVDYKSSLKKNIDEKETKANFVQKEKDQKINCPSISFEKKQNLQTSLDPQKLDNQKYLEDDSKKDEHSSSHPLSSKLKDNADIESLSIQNDKEHSSNKNSIVRMFKESRENPEQAKKELHPVSSPVQAKDIHVLDSEIKSSEKVNKPTEINQKIEQKHKEECENHGNKKHAIMKKHFNNTRSSSCEPEDRIGKESHLKSTAEHKYGMQKTKLEKPRASSCEPKSKHKMEVKTGLGSSQSSTRLVQDVGPELLGSKIEVLGKQVDQKRKFEKSEISYCRSEVINKTDGKIDIGLSSKTAFGHEHKSNSNVSDKHNRDISKENMCIPRSSNCDKQHTNPNKLSLSCHASNSTPPFPNNKKHKWKDILEKPRASSCEPERKRKRELCSEDGHPVRKMKRSLSTELSTPSSKASLESFGSGSCIENNRNMENKKGANEKLQISTSEVVVKARLNSDKQPVISRSDTVVPREQHVNVSLIDSSDKKLTNKRRRSCSPMSFGTSISEFESKEKRIRPSSTEPFVQGEFVLSKSFSSSGHPLNPKNSPLGHVSNNTEKLLNSVSSGRTTECSQKDSVLQGFETDVQNELTKHSHTGCAQGKAQETLRDSPNLFDRMQKSLPFETLTERKELPLENKKVETIGKERSFDSGNDSNSSSKKPSKAGCNIFDLFK